MQASQIKNSRLTTPNSVLMVTCAAKDNSFQKPLVSTGRNRAEISKNACAEFDEMVRTLRMKHNGRGV